MVQAAGRSLHPHNGAGTILGAMTHMLMQQMLMPAIQGASSLLLHPDAHTHARATEAAILCPTRAHNRPTADAPTPAHGQESIRNEWPTLATHPGPQLAHPPWLMGESASAKSMSDVVLPVPQL